MVQNKEEGKDDEDEEEDEEEDQDDPDVDKEEYLRQINKQEKGQLSFKQAHYWVRGVTKRVTNVYAL